MSKASEWAARWQELQTQMRELLFLRDASPKYGATAEVNELGDLTLNDSVLDPVQAVGLALWILDTFKEGNTP